MRLLPAVAVLLACAQLNADDSKAIYAPFMSIAAPSPGRYPMDSLRSCSVGFKVSDGKKNSPQGHSYPIPCVPSNSHVLDAQTISFNEVCQNIFWCDNGTPTTTTFAATGDTPTLDETSDGNAKDDSPALAKRSVATGLICGDRKTEAVTSGSPSQNKFVFTDSRVCLATGTVMKMHDAGGSLRPRFERQDGLKEYASQAFVRTITAAIDAKTLDFQDSKAPYLYGNKFDWDATAPVECSGCLNSSRLLYAAKDNAIFKIELFPTTNCEWIFICYDFKKAKTSSCNRRSEMLFLLKNGVLTTGTRKSAFTLDFASGRTIRIERDQTTGMFVVTTGQNERVVISGFNTKMIAFAMSSATCFEQPIAVEGNKSIGKGYRLEGSENTEDYNPPVENKASPAPTVEVPTDPPSTTIVALIDTVPMTTEPPYQAPAMSKTQAVVARSNDTKPARRGWLTWAYFYGSLAGTLLGFIICGVLFYLCRRTIYNSWYRGMCKRYGCDASGTTGGITGAEFRATTTGGNTTIGATTAGQTTVGGTSTMTGGTTSGGTTMTSGGTKSMITM